MLSNKYLREIESKTLSLSLKKVPMKSINKAIAFLKLYATWLLRTKKKELTIYVDHHNYTAEYILVMHEIELKLSFSIHEDVHFTLSSDCYSQSNYVNSNEKIYELLMMLHNNNLIYSYIQSACFNILCSFLVEKEVNFSDVDTNNEIKTCGARHLTYTVKDKKTTIYINKNSTIEKTFKKLIDFVISL